MKDTRSVEDAENPFPVLEERREYRITEDYEVVVENGLVRFYRADEEVLRISEWDLSEFNLSYLGDRIDQIVKNTRKKREEFLER